MQKKKNLIIINKNKNYQAHIYCFSFPWTLSWAKEQISMVQEEKGQEFQT